MGRESKWTPEEDALLLQTTGHTAVLVNKLLSEAGFETRTPQQIKDRRLRLQNKQDKQFMIQLREPLPAESDAPDIELAKAIFQKHQMIAEIAALKERLEALSLRIHELTKKLEDGQ